MQSEVFFSSKNDDWATPQSFFDQLDAEFHFTLDPCASSENAKCRKFYTQHEDGLAQDWGGEVVFCNPPYGRKIADWVKKCCEILKKRPFRHYNTANRSLAMVGTMAGESKLRARCCWTQASRKRTTYSDATCLSAIRATRKKRPLHGWVKPGGRDSYRLRCYTGTRRATSTKAGAAFNASGPTRKSCPATAKNTLRNN